MKKEEFRERHLEHRKSVLRGFLNRTGSENGDCHRAMKDGAIVTCRSLWELLGVTMYSKNQEAQVALMNPPRFGAAISFLEDFSIQPVTELEFSKFPDKEEVKKVMIAGNKCVAHIDEYPDHDVTEDILDQVIKRTLEQIEIRIT
ncbi:MAG: hypothetical protein SFY80_02455 [Verrucomicrobiota bacterium]|nr:hypothetical protein [Verrucomicrobiota bacterium]